jgi:hypothetical protein
MTTTVSIRNLARNTNILQHYDYVDLDEIMQFVGSGSIEEKHMDMTSRGLREARALRL